MVADGATLMHGQAGRRRQAARFLERAGVLPDRAQRAIDRFTIGATVTAALVAAVTLALALAGGGLAGWHPPPALVPAVLLGFGAWALVLLGQWLARRRGAPPSPAVPPDRGAPRPRGVVGAIRGAGIVRHPRPWGAQLGWSALGLALEAATLVAALEGVGGGVPVLDAVAVYAALHLLWSLLPVTGAPGAADVALLLALTALGAPLAGACAAVVTFRVLTFWIPAALGSLLSAGFEHRLLT
jgi:undecaprenyl-diphosphatase